MLSHAAIVKLSSRKLPSQAAQLLLRLLATYDLSIWRVWDYHVAELDRTAANRSMNYLIAQGFIEVGPRVKVSGTGMGQSFTYRLAHKWWSTVEEQVERARRIREMKERESLIWPSQEKVETKASSVAPPTSPS